MKEKILLGIALLAYAVSSTAAEVITKFEINEGQKSYRFVVENVMDDVITCKQLKVVADYGNEDCSVIGGSYTFEQKNEVFQPHATILNPTFGIDFLYQKNKRLKANNIFCGTPVVSQICN